MSSRNNEAKTDTRFKKGNSGRPKGARHKVTLAVQGLLDGEAEAFLLGWPLRRPWTAI